MSVQVNGCNGFSGISENMLRHKCKAKYYPTADGGRRLASVIQFNNPIFRERGWEESKPLPTGYLHLLAQLQDAERRGDLAQRANLIERLSQMENEYYHGRQLFYVDVDIDCGDGAEWEEAHKRDLLARAVRRAKQACFDMIMCNPDMNAFGTLTFDPKTINSTSYDECYRHVKTWFSNRVQRAAMKYIVVPEYHADGEKIHFHAIFTGKSAKMDKARYADTGRLVKRRRNGENKQIFNLRDWQYGFSAVELIDGADATSKVAKYVFKYMGKNMGNKIGGRYYLHGGAMKMPMYEYGDDAESLFGGEKPKYSKTVQVTSGVEFSQWTFI